MVGTSNNVQNYYNVSNGKVVKSFGKNEPENVATTKRTNKKGDVVYEQIFSFIEGRIIDAKLQSHDEYGDSIKLTFSDGIESAELQIKFDSAYGRSFLFKLPNCDFSKYVKLTPYQFTDKQTGKDVTGLNLQQDGKKIDNFYTKDTPNGLPQLKKVKFNGKDQWDKTDQFEFLKAKYDVFCAGIKNLPTVYENHSADDFDF